MIRSPTGRAMRGFTLVEVMVVLVIIGITLGMVSFNALPSPRQRLLSEATRISLLLQLARDEAIVRNKLVAFEVDSERYRFLVRNDAGWEPVTKEEMLREREFKGGPYNMMIDPPSAGSGSPMRITFGREPVDKPFVLTLALGSDSVAVRADGVGHFVVD